MNGGYAEDHEGLITLFSAPDHPQFQVCSIGYLYWLSSLPPVVVSSCGSTKMVTRWQDFLYLVDVVTCV